MPDQIRARVVVTALLILLTVAGIRALGPAGDWARPVGPVLIVSLLLEAAFVAMYIGLRWRHAPSAAELAGKLNKIVSNALVACMTGVLIGLILFEAHFKPTQPRRTPPRVRLGGGHSVRITRIPNPSLPLRDILIAILIAALIAFLFVAWRRRRLARLRLALLADADVDEAADDLARAVESGRAALRDELDDARAAIIACYVAMEKSLGEAGAARGAAETPDELLVRAVAAGLVPQAPAGALTELFYEARYSTHPMPMSKRDQAERALAGIATRLPAGERT